MPVDITSPARLRRAASPARGPASAALAAVVLLALAGCMVGPDFATPDAPVAAKWLESADGSIAAERQHSEDWWTVFHDPVLERLIRTAYEQNLTLQAAGARVLEARATLGVAIGDFYPQTQQIGADTGYNQASAVDPTSNPNNALGNYWRATMGVRIAWELDFWGKFRRGVQSADAAYLASIASYDDVLVTLLGDVASTYIGIRTLQTQIAIARDNVVKQRRALEIARDRFHGGAATGLDVAQAENVLAQTEAQVPKLAAQLQQGEDALRVLLGMAPELAGRAAGRTGRHSGAAGRDRHRHPRRVAAPPPGHPRGRTQCRGAKRADRHGQGRSVPRLQPGRQLRHGGGQRGQQPGERGVHLARHPVRLRSQLLLAGAELRPDHQHRARAGRPAAGAADPVPGRPC